MNSNQNNRGLETIPFQIVNQSGLDAPLYIWIQGIIPIIPYKPPFEYVYVNDLKGNVADMPKSSTKATFSMLLPAKDTTIALPRLVSLRVYLSFGEQLFTTTSADGNPVSPRAGTLMIQFKVGITLYLETSRWRMRYSQR